MAGEAARAPAGLRALAWAVRRLPAGRYRAMKWVRGEHPPFTTHLPEALGGARFACDLRDDIAREVFLTGRYGAQETALLRAVLRPGDVFVDVGANWGYFTLLAASLVGRAGCVVALEPHPALFRALRDNAAANAMGQVDALALAAADAEGTLTLHAHADDAGNRGVSSLLEGGGDGERFAVKAARLDDVLDARKLDRVELLKMDIEGAEEMALRGMTEGLARGRYRRLLLELHPAVHPDGAALVARVVSLLRAAGYTGWTVDHSPAATRRAAYARRPAPRAFLRPLDERPDAWPHQLWLADGEAAPS